MMGWQDAPLVEDEKTPAWQSAPELDISPSGHGPIGKRYKPPPPPPVDPLAKYEGMSALDKLKNDLGISGDAFSGLIDSFNRMSSRALTGSAAMVGDIGQGTYNLAAHPDDWKWSEALDNPFNPTPHYGWEPLPSEKIESLMDRYVAPPPQTSGGRITELLGSALLSHKLPSIYTPKQVPTAPNPKLPNPLPDEVVALGKKHRVPVYYDDISQNPLVKKTGVFAESLPGALGTGAGRISQNEAAMDAAKLAAQQQAPAASEAVDVLMQQSMRRKLDLLKDMKTKLYDKAGAELDPHGIVPTPRLNYAFATARNELSQLPMRANKVVLKTLKELYQQGGLHKFSVTSKLSDSLGKRIDDFYTGADTTLGSEGVQYLKRMKDGLDGDIADFANNVNKVGPGGRQAYKVADDFYKTHLAPYRAEGFSGLVRNTEPEKVWQYLVAQGGVPSRVTRMYNALDAEGQQAARYGLVKEAFTNSLSEKGIFSPAKFANYLERNENVVKQFFKGTDLDEINGFRKLMRHVDRSGQYMENPANGQRILLPALVGSGLYSLKIPTMAVGTGVGARVLFQTEKGRDLLRALAKEAPTSEQYKKLLNNTMQYLTHTAVLDRQNSAPTALDINDIIENAAGPGVGPR